MEEEEEEKEGTCKFLAYLQLSKLVIFNRIRDRAYLEHQLATQGGAHVSEAEPTEETCWRCTSILRADKSPATKQTHNSSQHRSSLHNPGSSCVTNTKEELEMHNVAC